MALAGGAAPVAASTAAPALPKMSTLPIVLEPAGRGLTLTVPDTGWVVVPVGSTRTGWVDVPRMLVPSVCSTGHEFAAVLGVPWLAVTVPETGCVPGKLDTLTVAVPCSWTFR